MEAPVNTTTAEERAALAALVRRRLAGADLLLAFCLGRDNIEAEFVVLWRRGDDEYRAYGTHRACLAIGWPLCVADDMLMWGHYDMDLHSSMVDFNRRIGRDE